MNIYLANLSSGILDSIPYSCGALQAYTSVDPEVYDSFTWKPYIFRTPEGVEREFNKMVNPGVLGITLYEWNKNRSLLLARLTKNKFPNCLIVFGGPSVPQKKAHDFLNEHFFIDVLCFGEGESNFLEILRRIKQGGSFGGIPNIAYRESEAVVVSSTPYTPLSPINYPSPSLMGLFDQCIEQLEEAGLSKNLAWETNRGCPFSCTFCDWGSYTQQKIRPFDEERLFSELEWIGENIEELHLCDANFGILPRDYQIAVKLAEMARKKAKLSSVLLAFTKNASDRSLKIGKILYEAGLLRTGVTLSLQSHSKPVSRNIKRQNISIERYKAAQDFCNREKIPHYTELIIPLPGETYESFLKGLEVTLEGEPSQLRVWPLQLYPNSEISDPMTIRKFNMKVEKWPLSEGANSDENEYADTVIETSDMSHKEFLKAKKISEMVDYLYFGKWVYYLGQYFKRKTKFPIVYLLDYLYVWSKENPNTVLGKILTGEFIEKYNKGSYLTFKGPINPYSINWKNKFFNKKTFFWLCISMHRDKFFQEISTALQERFGPSEELDDLIIFQKNVMFDFDRYRPSIGTSFRHCHNWKDYFTRNGNLQKSDVELTFTDKFVGGKNNRVPIDFKDPECLFIAAGGSPFYRQKEGVCCHDLTKAIINQPGN